MKLSSRRCPSPAAPSVHPLHGGTPSHHPVPGGTPSRHPLHGRTPSHHPLSPSPVGRCMCGGRVRGGCAGCACPSRCAREECQPLSHGHPPPPSPAGIKLLLTWDPISFIAAPTFPPRQPPGRERQQLRDGEGEPRTKSIFDWRVQKSAGRYVGARAACPPRRTGS